jgi:signal transduction histidine kinase
VARRRRTGAVVTAAVAGAAAVAVWPAAAAAMPLWALAWQLTLGLGCAVAGHVITLTDHSGVAVDRRRATGALLILAALSLYAGPVLAGAGQPDLARGVWVGTVLVTIPLALLQVVPPRRATRWVDASVTVTGLTTAVVSAAGPPSVAVLLGLLSAVLVVVATGLRYEMTAGDDRRRILWVILGFLSPVPSGLIPLVAASTAGGLTVVLVVVAAISSLSLPLAAGIALVAPRIVDVRALMERLTVAALMFALAAATYIGTEAAIGDPSSGVRVLIVFGIAAAFHPVMRWVRASVNEMLFGGRADPVHALTLLGNRLADGTSPPDWLDTLRLALAAPGVTLRQGDRVIATSGDLGDSPTTRTELRAGAAPVGELVVALATDDPRLARATEAVLSLVSVPLAQALHAAHLTEDLRVSRGRAVTALEEERRRVRRDLHDGLGSTLTGIAYSADAVANLMHSHPGEALEILHGLRGEARDAIAEIRRIVYDLRPRALDELGLIEAVRQQVSRLRTADGRALTVAFDAARDLPELPAAVEVAAYRVAVEALTNVARHSGVAEASASFALTPGPALAVTVRDRGHSAGAWTPGVGIASMRERVEQVGGTLLMRAGADGATVTAQIPIPA